MFDDHHQRGIARYVGSVPGDGSVLSRLLDVGDVALYHVQPPLAGYHVVAAAQTSWAVRMRVVGDEGPADDPVSTMLFGVDGGEAAQIDRAVPLCDPVNGRTPERALKELGYSVR